MLKLYTMVVTKLQHKWGQLALTIVKIETAIQWYSVKYNRQNRTPI